MGDPALCAVQAVPFIGYRAPGQYPRSPSAARLRLSSLRLCAEEGGGGYHRYADVGGRMGVSIEAWKSSSGRCVC